MFLLNLWSERKKIWISSNFEDKSNIYTEFPQGGMHGVFLYFVADIAENVSLFNADIDFHYK